MMIANARKQKCSNEGKGTSGAQLSYSAKIGALLLPKSFFFRSTTVVIGPYCSTAAKNSQIIHITAAQVTMNFTANSKPARPTSFNVIRGCAVIRPLVEFLEA